MESSRGEKMWTSDFLFIGGKLDGQWLPVKLNTFGEPEHFWKTSVTPEYPLATESTAVAIKAAPACCQQQIYKREQLSCKHKIWYFYISAEVEVIDILGELLKGYKRRKEEK